MNTYEFTYRGYTIVQKGETFGLVQKEDFCGVTFNLIDLIKAIDEQWSKANAQDLCSDCNDPATGKAMMVLARGNAPEVVHFCNWHAELYK